MWSIVKRAERMGKSVLALLATAILWRPGRVARARRAIERLNRVLVVRLDDRLGEALLTTPVFSTLKTRVPAPEVHALVHPNAVRVLKGHSDVDKVIPFDRRRSILAGWVPGILPLRRSRYDAVVNSANWTDPSVADAIISRLAGPKSAVIGPKAWPVRGLYSTPVPPQPRTRSEVLQRVHLLSPIAGCQPTCALSFRPIRVGSSFSLPEQPYAVVNPGGRLRWRKIPTEAFSAAARTLLSLGIRPVVTWGPGEQALAEAVGAGAPGANLAPATGLDELAAILRGARLCVCNNTGPMHLSVSLGTPTLALFLHMETDRWGHPYAPHRIVNLTPVIDSPALVILQVERELREFAAIPTQTK